MEMSTFRVIITPNYDNQSTKVEDKHINSMGFLGNIVSKR